MTVDGVVDFDRLRCLFERALLMSVIGLLFNVFGSIWCTGSSFLHKITYTCRFTKLGWRFGWGIDHITYMYDWTGLAWWDGQRIRLLCPSNLDELVLRGFDPFQRI